LDGGSERDTLGPDRIMHFDATNRIAVHALLLGLSLAVSACSRRPVEPQRKEPSASPSASPAPPARAPLLPAPVPPEPPKTPAVPPQIVACGERDFYRITADAFEAFEVAVKLPPPEIRGSRVARKVTRLAVAEPSNVLALGAKRALVVAKDGVHRYEHGKPEARRYPPVAERGPFAAWLDPRRADGLRVHAAGESNLHEYTLANATAKARVQPLPEFDTRLITVLASGTALYSTSKGFSQEGRAASSVPSGELGEPAIALWAGPTQDRYWAASASGKLALFDLKAASPLVSTTVPGAVLDVAVSGERSAALSLALSGPDYRTTVTLFTKAAPVAEFPLGPTFAIPKQPEIDLCLLSGGPWLVVGGKQWLQLLDWQTRRLLAEW